jgi:lysophospholipase L1-like esterase
MAEQKKTTSIHRQLLMLLASPILIILLVEAGLRIMKPPITYTATMPCVFQEDEQLGYSLIPNSHGRLSSAFEVDNEFQINSMGFNDVERGTITKTAKPRILAIGDSFTMAVEVPLANGWTQTMEREFADRSVEVFNMGIGGTGTDAHLALLKQYAPILQPDIVILAFFGNDIEDIQIGRKLVCDGDYTLVYQTEQQRQQIRDFIQQYGPGTLAKTLARNSYFFRAISPFIMKGGILLQTNMISPGPIGVPTEPRRPLNPGEVDDLFLEFTTLAETFDFTLLIIPVPSKEQADSSANVLREQVSADVLSQLTVLDVNPAIAAWLEQTGRDRESLYFDFDGHFNAEGYHLFGQTIADAVRPYLPLTSVSYTNTEKKFD